MAAIAGLIGTGEFTTDERPKDWRQSIIHLFPNGEAKLTAILGMLPKEDARDAEFNWWEKRMVTGRMKVNGAQLAADTAIEVDSGAKGAVKGTMLMNERTGERMRVSANPTTDVGLTVTRGFGTTIAAAMVDDDYLVIVGNAYPEGGTAPKGRWYAPVKYRNFTQIFRCSLEVTRTARQTTLRWDPSGNYKQLKRETLGLYSVEQEKAYIWGQPYETVDADNGKMLRTTGGLLSFLTTNIRGGTAGADDGSSNPFAVDGPISEEMLDYICEHIFRYGSTEKLVFAGSTFLRAVTYLAKKGGHLQMVPSNRSYGMKIVEWTTPSGVLYMTSHPLFNQHPEWRKNALVVDPKNIRMKVMLDTKFVPNRQANDEDLSKDEFIGEMGLELHLEETHAYIEGVTSPLIV